MYRPDSPLIYTPLYAGPAPRKLSFGGGRQPPKKKKLVLDDSDEEGAEMADADSGEDSGSVFEAQDADASSSEDEGDSAAADASDEVLSSGTRLRQVTAGTEHVKACENPRGACSQSHLTF